MVEVWKAVPDFEGAYEVSNLGGLRTVERKVWFTSKLGNRHLRVKKSRAVAVPVGNHGYKMAYLMLDGKRYADTLHSLVARVFIGERPVGHDVCHYDGDKLNCAASNLRYDTRTNNHKDKDRHGTKARGSMIRQAKLTEAKVAEIKSCRDDGPVKLAQRYGMSRIAIARILDGRSWRHVL